MPKPLVSILVPFKNTEAYIADCLDSILKQSHSNWEAIFVEDSSSDNSYTIVESFAENDARIQLYKNAGNGIIDALKNRAKNIWLSDK